MEESPGYTPVPVRCRGWCLTLYAQPDRVLPLTDGLIYYVIGEEVCPDTGRLHWHVYLHFKNAVGFRHVLAMFPTAHIENRVGTAEQAIQYVKKDGKFVEGGTEPLTSSRKGAIGSEAAIARWDSARSNAKLGSYDEIPSDMYVRYYGNLHSIHTENQVLPPPLPSLQNEWLVGPSGTGKSYTARMENPGAYLKNLNKWWDGYMGQSCAIIDEWAPIHDKLASHLKLWADHYPFTAEVKGSSLCIRPTKIVVTSNYTIEECFPLESDRDPLLRRFKVRYFTEPMVPPQ